MSKRNTGSGSQRAFEDTYKKLGKYAVVHRITDSAEVRGMNGRGFTKPQPSDYVVTEGGVTFYAEVKSTANKTSFPFKQIETGQRVAARLQTIAGGPYFFFIHRIETNDWFKVPAAVIFASDKQSMTWAELEPFRWSLFHHA